MKISRLPIAAAALMALGSNANAHHSAAAQYEVEKSITLTGVVKEFRFINPHSVVRLAVTGENGAEVIWIAEWAPTTILRRMGMKADAIKAGDRVTIQGNPARDGSRDLLLQRLTFADGRQLGFGGGAGPAAPGGRPRNAE